MKLHFFGCGSAFNPAMGNTSAWFEMDGCLFLVDCGETVYELLMKRSNLREYRQIYVLLTHLHADHVGSLGSLISYNYCILGRKICVIHPRATVVSFCGLWASRMNFTIITRNFRRTRAVLGLNRCRWSMRTIWTASGTFWRQRG